MSKNVHKTALIPLETWEYNSPILKHEGKSVDIGLLAEGLIYYDQVVLNISTVKQLEDIIIWFIKQNKYDLFLELLNSKTIRFLYYAFLSTAVRNTEKNEFSIWNINTKKLPNAVDDFMRLIVYRLNLRDYINNRKMIRLYKAIENNYIEETAEGDAYESPIVEARKIFEDTNQYSLLVQSYVNCIFKYLKLGIPPLVKTTVLKKTQASFSINTNVNYQSINQLTGEALSFRNEMPLIGAAYSNKLIWTSIKYGYDLFLGEVSSTVVGNKLVESQSTNNKTGDIIGTLKEEIEFPNIRYEVNKGNLDIDFVVKIRKNSSLFRSWLQQESERDRNAIIAYHHDVKKASGISKVVSSSFRIFGNIGKWGLPFYVAMRPDLVKGVPPEIVSLLTSAGGAYLDKVADAFNNEWKPVIFGDYLAGEFGREKTTENKKI